MSERKLPWWFRLDEWLHRHIDKRLGRHVGLWRTVYTGPRKWFCDWADLKMQRYELRETARIVQTICFDQLNTTSASNAVVTCACPRHRP